MVILILLIMTMEENSAEVPGNVSTGADLIQINDQVDGDPVLAGDRIDSQSHGNLAEDMGSVSQYPYQDVEYMVTNSICAERTSTLPPVHPDGFTREAKRDFNAEQVFAHIGAEIEVFCVEEHESFFLIEDLLKAIETGLKQRGYNFTLEQDGNDTRFAILSKEDDEEWQY